MATVSINFVISNFVYILGSLITNENQFEIHIDIFLFPLLVRDWRERKLYWQ